MSVLYCPCGHEEDNDQHACPVTQKRLRQTLSLAEEGLANYAQENEQLKADLTRARLRVEAMALLLYGPAQPQTAPIDTVTR
jgi:hypothetical protein